MRAVTVICWVCAICAAVMARLFGASFIVMFLAAVAGYHAYPLFIIVGLRVSRWLLNRSPQGRAAVAIQEAEQTEARRKWDEIQKRRAEGKPVNALEAHRVEGVLFRNEGCLGKSAPGHEWLAILESGPSTGLPAEIADAIKGALIPMRVLPRNFISNLRFLEAGGLEFMLPLDDQPRPIPTPTVAKSPRRMDWPPAQPLWLIAAFPDVSEWASRTFAEAEFDHDPEAERFAAAWAEKLERFVRDAGVDVEDDAAVQRLLFDTDGKMNAAQARLLAEWYLECRGGFLETALN